jgi:hypothetical protein
MKLLAFILLIPSLLWAQDKNVFVNLQLHRDFHREIFTSTVEIFELDRLGTTFFFTDFDFGSTGQSGSYFEISRNMRVLPLGKATGNISLQYNDGVLPSDDTAGKGIPRTVLAGVAVSDLMWGPAYFEVQALARQEFAANLGWQLTGVWNWPISGTPFEFLGYIDWNTNETGNQPISVQTEPQFQWRKNAWAVGSEVEISRNFSGAYTVKHGFSYHTWYVHPTIYLRLYF